MIIRSYRQVWAAVQLWAIAYLAIGVVAATIGAFTNPEVDGGARLMRVVTWPADVERALQ